MNFVFVDETGDPGSEILKGASRFFGLALLNIMDRDYESLRYLLSQIDWLSGTAASINIGRRPIKALSLLRGLKELARNSIVSASGLYISKEDYGGRYTEWSDIDVPRNEWGYYLRNYLLRHLLEFHFSAFNASGEAIDLVMDRVLLTESQRQNTLKYLNSITTFPLREPFKIPRIEFLTIADSQYVGVLEIAHILAGTLREIAKGTIIENLREVSDFIRVEHFIGHPKDTQ